MDVKKSFIMVCLMILIMIIIGGVSASEDIGSVSSSGDLNATLKVNDIDEVDNLASDNGADSDDGNLKANDNNERISASNENDLVGAIDDTGRGNTFSDLSSFLTATSSNGQDIILTHDYSGTGAEINVRYLLSITGNKAGTGGAITIDHQNAAARIFSVYGGQSITFQNIIRIRLPL